MSRAEGVWDRTRFAVKNRLGLVEPPIVIPYRGFGDATRYWLKGRVLEDPGISQEAAEHSLRQNLWLTYKRYETDEVPDARLAWRFGERSGEVTTDEEGYFETTIEPGGAHDTGRAWQAVEVELLDSPVRGTRPHLARAMVRTPGRDASFGIISDIDDTIVETGATNLVRHWRTVIANSAQTRVAFPGLAAFYRGLVGPGERNPVFYVSSSPWNLFDLFERFLHLRGIPHGPMLLKDFGLTQTRWLTGGHHGHKSEMIETILAAYPALRFILIGDSGQRDAFIYRDIAKAHPGRIAAIYIREIKGGRHHALVEEALEEARGLGVDTACGDDLWVAAEHAAERGWLGEEHLETVRRDVKRDEAA
ncbi:hypothetical protein N177_0980 [Lutibaculum baratangense AMV1]|uniref:Phosphatidate phosphatase APP1 catalytic domain-containing protein n=1 Tax=Lutibaculum baratangense AMV1 TaxID=631454 RepID=V4RTS0_9HYPH|nr:hypothetical protein N177_0980 [Lutibaculum baratangense AMV1]